MGDVVGRKYELTDDTFCFVNGPTLRRIRAVRDIDTIEGRVKAGALGGFIQSEHNLSHDGNSWVGDHATVFGNAQVRGNALVAWEAKVSDNAYVGGNAYVIGDVRGNAKVSGDTRVGRNDLVTGDVHVKHELADGETVMTNDQNSGGARSASAETLAERVTRRKAGDSDSFQNRSGEKGDGDRAR
jgi:hypothetical protein